MKGSITGVKGINTDGNSVDEASFEYEICYKCHAGQSWSPGSPTSRAISQNNTRLEFDSGNPSYHPVEAAGRNANVPSLLTNYSTTSIIFCSDCHSSDGSNVPKGPHGSTYPRILKYNYTTADNSSESATAYELCYSCHSRTSILADESFAYHNLHIREERTPCNVCHDPHGISATQGNSDNDHLINFDINVVAVYNGTRRFQDLGTYTGSCTLRCHGENHNNRRY